MATATKETVVIDQDKCVGCGSCLEACVAFRTLSLGADGKAHFDPAGGCIGCGHCMCICPAAAISLRGADPEKVRQFPGGKPPVDFDTITAVVQHRRSIRKYKPEPVPRQLLEKLLDAARHAPTASNSEKNEFAVITNPATLNEIRAIVEEGFAAQNPKYWAALNDPSKPKRDIVLRGAPCLLVARSPWGAADVAISIEIIELIAPTLGLGTCWAGMVMRVAEASPKLRAVFQRIGIPSGVIYGALMIGLADEAYIRAPPRKPLRVIWA